MLVGAGGELSQSVEALARPLVAASGTGMMTERAPVHACIYRLLSCEVPRLRLGLSIKAFVIYVRHIMEIIT
jgi:hypothetical protein